MENKFLKYSTVFLASTILLQPLTMSSAQVKAATTEKNNDQQKKEEYIKYKEAWIKAINEMPDSDYLQENAGLNKGAADAVAATFVTVIL
ncbi:hypothetical protein [Staphylococcus xylosus]